MDQAALPLNFYCRNARLCLKKATFAKKSQLFHDELNHLHQFETLVGTTIPEHAQFEDRKTDKQIVELQIFLGDARRRIQELEGDSNRSHILGHLKSSPSSSRSDKSTPRSKSSTKSPRLTELSSPSAVTQAPKSSKKSSSRALSIPSKKADALQQQKQQSWGVWTANPQDISISSPSKKHSSSMHKSRKLAGDLKSPPSSTSQDASFLLPLRSSSPDQRAEAILGGCALLASHLQSFEDGRDDLDPKREELVAGFPTSDKMSSSWLLNYSKSQDRVDHSDMPIVEDDVKSSEKGTIGGRRFRFAPDYFEKRLQGRLNRIQHHCPNTDEDTCGSSPSKVRISTEKSHEADLQEHGSSERINKRISPRLDTSLGGIDKALADMKNELLAESERLRNAERQQIEALIEEKIERCSLNELRAESERLRKAERQQIEALIEEKIERRLSQPMEIASGGKEKVMADMKTELRLLWTEVDLLIKGREEIKDNMEQLNQIAEKAKEAIGKEQDLLKTENGSLKKQLHYFKKESMQIRIDSEDFKRDLELEVKDMRANIRRLKEEGEDVKENINFLKKARDDLTRENRSLQKLVEGIREESATRIREAEAFRRGNDEFEMLRGVARDGNRDKALMERVEKLSQLYLGGLEEVRRDLTSVKIACDDRLDELECQWGQLKQQQENNAESEESLRELVLDGLETRISHLESLLHEKKNFDEEQSKVLSSVAIIDQNREHAASALAQVVAASQKAEEFLTETLGKFHSEMTNMKRQSVIIQEKLLAEKEVAAAALAEVLRMREHLGKETETTMSLISDAKSRTVQFQEGLEREREGLRGSIMIAEKEREAALAAAAEAAAAADKAAKALGEIHEVRRKSVSFSEHISEVFGETHRKYTQELEGHIEGWQRSMQEEVSRARVHVQVIEEEKRKSQGHIDGWRQMMLDEVDNAKTVVEGIKEEKRRSVCIAEATMFREQHDYEQHKKITETTIEELAQAIREISESLDYKLHSVQEKQAHAEQQDAHFQKEIVDVSEKIKEAFTKLEKVSQDSAHLAQELQSSKANGDEISAMLQKDTSTLESFVKEMIAEQATVVEKMKKVEIAHTDLAHSVEGIQASTQELEKSGTLWLQKYDTAARILQDIEKRLSNLENASLDEDNPNQQLNNVTTGHQIMAAEKQRLIKLYRELSGFLQKMKSREGKLENLNIDESFEDEWAKSFNDKIMALDVRVKHVESDAFPKLKVLETKTEELSVGMQSALEGASTAENKCSALGAELVKVFRMMASSRKESPTKMMMGDGHDEDNEQHHPHHRSRCIRSHHAGAKSKNAACTYCKRAAMRGANDLDCTKEHQDVDHMQADTIDNTLLDGHKAGYYYDGSNFGNVSPSMDRSYKESGPQGKPEDMNHARAYHGGEDLLLEKSNKRNTGQNEKSHRKGELMEKIDDFEALEHLLSKKNLSELKTFEGKLPITHEKLDEKRLECAKKDVTHTGSGKNCQSTNIRLEAGKIQVNVSHRSAVLSGSRVTKRGDAISVRP